MFRAFQRASSRLFERDIAPAIPMFCAMLVFALLAPLAVAQTAPTFTGVDVGMSGVEACEVNWGDYDNDGDLDLGLEGFVSGSRVTRLYRNDGGTFVLEGNATLSSCTEGPIVWGDYDNDGDLDLMFGGWNGGTGSLMYRNEGGGSFFYLNNGLRGMKGADAAWGDYDNDGDLDLILVGESYQNPTGDYAQIYRNSGNGQFPLAVSLPGVYLGEVAWGDYDGDGDLDIAITGRTVGSRIFRNDGGSFTDIAAGFPGLIYSSVAWGDYDNDGDLDLALCGSANGSTATHCAIYRNDSGIFVDAGAGLPAVQGGRLQWGDGDNDGDLDLLVVGAGADGAQVSRIYLNDHGAFVDAHAAFTGVWNHATAAWGDYDNDGDLDVVMGGQTSDAVYQTLIYRNDGVAPNAPPSVAQGLSSSVNGSDFTFAWEAATDAETPASGLTYNLRVGTTPGGEEVVTPMADLTTGWRRVAAPGNAQERCSWTIKNLNADYYYYSVQAIDSGFKASGWAAERIATALPQDPGSPQVVSTVPADASTGVIRNISITVTFSEAMNRPSVEASFSISPAVGGEFRWDGLTMTFVPASDLLSDTLYTIGIGEGAVDLAGTPLLSPYGMSFETSSLAGTPLPAGYVKTLLHLGATESDRIAGLPFTGDEMGGEWDFFQLAGLGPEYLQQPAPARAAPMPNITTTQTPLVWTALTDSDADGVWYEGIGNTYVSYAALYVLVPSARRTILKAQYDDVLTVWMDGNPAPVLSSQPASVPFDMAAGIHCIIIKLWEDEQGDQFGVKFTDESGADMTDLRYVLDDFFPPLVSSVFPAISATAVPVWSDVVIQFSERMDTTVDPSTVASIDGSASGAWSWGDPYRLVWTPSGPLDGATSYTVSLTAANARDVRGNTLVGGGGCTFTTAALSSPTVDSVSVTSANANTLVTGITLSGTGFQEGTVLHSPGAIPFNGHYYRFPATWKNWTDAQADCEATGGHLATLSSAEEDDYVWRLGARFNSWIGYTDEGDQQNWRWVSGEPTVYTHWADGEPNNWLGQHEDWGVYWWGFRWADIVQGTRPYVCEYDGRAVPTVKLVQAGGPTVTATNVRFNNSGSLTFDLDLFGVAAGVWDVVVVNQDGQTNTLPGTFTTTDFPVVMEVTSVTPSGTYGAGESIEIAMRFSHPVRVTGLPELVLETGTQDAKAIFSGGSETDTLTFTYEIAQGEFATDLDYSSVGALSPAGGTIRDIGGNDALLPLPAPGSPGSLGANRDIIVGWGLPPGTPDPATWVTNGSVFAIAPGDQGIAYIGGDFTHVGPYTGSMVALDPETGATDPMFPLVNGAVYAVAPDGVGGWFVGGGFTRVGDYDRSRLAHVLAGGQVDLLWNPGASGTVYAFAVSDGTMYVGGDFTSIQGQARNRLAAVDVATGLVTPWDPNVNKAVRSVEVSQGLVYIGGSFDMVGGQSRNRLAAIDAATGIPTAWNPAPSAELSPLVNDLVIADGIVYVGGEFNSINGQERGCGAAFDGLTGALTPWNPASDGQITALAVAGDTVYVGGEFGAVGGQARNRLAAVDTASGLVKDWNPGANGYVWTLTVSGGLVYAGGSFNSIGGQSRSFLAAVDANTGLATPWDPVADGSVRAVRVSNGTVLAGGIFISVGGKSRNNLAAIDVTTGAATDWNPDVNGQVWALKVSGGTVYAGGTFSEVGGQPRNLLAAVDAATGLPSAWNPDVNGWRVMALDASGDTVYVGGDFSAVGGQPRNRIAAVDADTGLPTSWNPGANSYVYALAAHGDVVYVGGSFNQIAGQSRDGLAAIDANSGAATSWEENLSSAGTGAVAVVDGVVYVSGAVYPVAGVDGAGIAALDAVTGAAKWGYAETSCAGGGMAVRDGIAYTTGGYSVADQGFEYGGVALDMSTGTPMNWGPIWTIEAQQGVIGAGPGTVWAGGGSSWSGQRFQGLYSFSNTRVDDVTSPSSDGTYHVGDTLEIRVAFARPVTVVGAPRLMLETGAVDRAAEYAGITGTRTLTFTYTVCPGDVSADLEYRGSNALILNDGFILGAAGVPAVLQLPRPNETGSLSRSKTLVIDGGNALEAPLIASPAEGSLVASSTVTLSGFAGTGLTVRVYEDGTALGESATGSGTTWSFTTGELAEGAHTFVARAVIAGTFISDPSAAVTVTIDTVAPQTTLTSVPPVLTNGSGASFSFSSNEAGSAFQSRLDGGAWEAVASPQSVTGLGEGSHTFEVQAVDPAGHQDPTPAFCTWTIDTTRPSIETVSSSAPNGVYRQGQEIVVTVRFTEAVFVVGSPRLILETGASDAAATFAGGSETDTLNFSYTVGSGQSSLDLDCASGSALDLNGGSIRDAAGNDAVVTVPFGGEAGSLSADRDLTIVLDSGVLVSADVEPAHLVAGAVGRVTVTFDSSSGIPADGIVEITFPSGFDVTGVGGITSGTLDGGFSISVAGQTVVIRRDGTGTAEGAGAQSLVIAGVTNPAAPGTAGSYGIRTANAAGDTIDQAEAVAADAFEAGAALMYLDEPGYAGDGADPDTITGGSTVVFRVVYQEPDNEAPTLHEVWIDADGDGYEPSERHRMEPEDADDSDYRDGCVYRASAAVYYEGRTSAPYTFAFADGHGVSAAPAPQRELVVNPGSVAPMLADPSSPFSSGVDGSSAPVYRFSTIYTDVSGATGTPPVVTEVWIDTNGDGAFSEAERFGMSKVEAADGNYADGVQYVFSMPLHTAGVKGYQFRFVNGTDLAGGAPASYREVVVAGTPDSDGDGRPDAEEGAGDFDGDGVSDAVDGDTVVMTLPNGDQVRVGVDASGAAFSSIEDLGADDPALGTGAGRPDLQWQGSLVTFTVTGFAPGTAITVRTEYPEPVASDSELWKYSPVSQAWMPVSYTIENVRTVVFSVTDGSVLDGDGIVNGSITDPFGLGSPVAVPVSAPSSGPTESGGGGGGGGGCGMVGADALLLLGFACFLRRKCRLRRLQRERL